MSEEVPLAELLVRAGKVFTLARQLGFAFEQEAQLPERGSVLAIWQRVGKTFRELSDSLLDLHEPMRNPPDGFASVAQQLLKAADLVKGIRKCLVGKDGAPDLLASYPDLKLVSQDGWESVNEVAESWQMDGVGGARAGIVFRRLTENDPDARAGWERASAKLTVFGLALRAVMNSPEYQALEELKRQHLKELADAIQAARKKTEDELAARHFPRPKSLEDWEHIALIAEIPAEKVLSGKLTIREIHACALAWADRQASKARLSGANEPAGDLAAAQGGTSARRRGRKKANLNTIQKEAEIAAAWARARDAGVFKSDFVKDNNLTIRKLKALLDRVAKRNRPSE
jgi:hypothetical protein